MLRILITFICLISTFSWAENNNVSMIPCAPELQRSLKQIQQVPEARELISKVQREGAISILVNRTIPGQFAAFWDQDERIIYVTLSSDRVEGSIIGSILFELHNALNTSKLDRYDILAREGKIDKNSYVEGVERLEYENSLNAARIAEKGIQMGIFPRGARLPTYASFEEHYRIQKMGGHSAWIANNYDQLARPSQFRFNHG